MNKLQAIWYLHQLNKLPNKVPYEKLSQYHTAKMQLQIRAKDITWGKVLWHPVHICISSIKGVYFRLNYYTDTGGRVKNHLTDTPYYIHIGKGLRSQSKNPHPGCKVCAAITEITWPDRPASHCFKTQNVY